MNLAVDSQSRAAAGSAAVAPSVISLSRRRPLLATTALTAAALAGLVMAGPLFTAGEALAQSAVWNGAGGNWGTATNWTPINVPDAVGDAAVFNNSGAAQPNVDLGGGTFGPSFLSLFESTDYTISNGTLNFVDVTGSSGVDSQSSANITLNISLTEQAGHAASVVHSGTGTLTLTNANSYTGGTTINAGAVNVQNSAALGTGAVAVASGATLELEGVALNVGNALTLNGTGVANGGALRNVSGSNIYGGTITLASASRINSDAGQLDIIGGITGANQNLTIGGAGNIFISSAITTGAGSLTKDGSGGLALVGNNTYTGATTINGGYVQINGGNAINDAGAVIVNAGGLLQVNAAETIGSLSGSGNVLLQTAGSLTTGGNNASTTFSGVISEFGPVGSLVKAGTGTFTLAGANTYTGATNINAGALVAANATALGTAANGTTVAAGASLTIANVAIGAEAVTLNGGTALTGTGTASLAGAVTLAASSTVTVGGTDQLTLSGAVSGVGFGIDKAGAGTLTLSGANTYTGVTTVTGGTLALTGGTAIANAGAVVVGAPGTLRVDQLEAIGSIAGAGNLILNAGLTTGGNNATTAVSGTLSGAGGLTKIGTGAFTLSNAGNAGFTGDILVVNGILIGSTAGSLGAASGDIFVTGGTGLSFGGAAHAKDALNVSGGAAQNGTIGVNTLVLSGTGEIAANATINVAGAAAQSGPLSTMAGTVTAATYRLDSGTISGNATASTAFDMRSGLVSGTLNGAAELVKSTAGTVTFSGANTYSGGTTVNAGTLQINPGGTLGNTAGTTRVNGGDLNLGGTTQTQASLTLSGGLIQNGALNAGAFNFTNTGIASANLAGAGALTKTGAGTAVLSGTNTFTGGTTVAAGTLRLQGGAALGNSGPVAVNGGALSIAASEIIGSLSGAGGTVDIDAGQTLTVNQTAAGMFAGEFADSGTLTKAGAGLLALTGDSSGFAGTTIVSGGSLIVGLNGEGSLGGMLDVRDGGILGGSGTVGTTVVGSGGTIAPGNSIGTLNVAGDVTFAAGSRYEVEVDPAGPDSDLIHATGQAFLNGGSVVHIGLGGTYDPTSIYTILTADGGLNGAFADVTSDFAFLDPALGYGANDVTLTLERNDIGFDDIGETRNQRATASGVESLDFGNDVYDAVVVLDGATARAAFDQLSGEIHASLKTALIEDSRHIRDAATNRIRAAFGGVGTSAGPVLAYGPDGTYAAPAGTEGMAGWGQVFGSWGETDGDGNAAQLDRSTGGLLVGADGMLGTWRLGLLAGYSHSSFDADDRASSASSDNYHLGAYAGTQWGALAFRSGLAYTWSDLATRRSVDFPGLSDSLEADYDAGTAQVFGELGYLAKAGRIAFEPFAGLAYVNLDTNGSSERGGGAALLSNGGSTNTTFSTLGVRVESGFEVGGMTAMARGMLGWRHAFGDITPLASQSFAGSEAFTVAGAPIAEDAAVIELGFVLDLTDWATLGLSYDGQFGSGAQDHSAKANFSLKF